MVTIRHEAQDSDLCLVLLTGSPDSFFRLSEARTAMEAQLREGGRLEVCCGWLSTAFDRGYVQSRYCCWFVCETQAPSVVRIPARDPGQCAPFGRPE